MKKILLGIMFLIVLGINSSYAGNIMKSSAYSTENTCKTTVKNNNSLYPNYSRSKCYKDEGYYYYNICAKGTDCNSGGMDNKSNTNKTTDNVNDTLKSCKIDTSLGDKLKGKLDNVVEKIKKKLGTKNSITKGYIYGFYDYFLGKVANSNKYKNNKIIQEVIKYLRDKFRCGVKKGIGENQEVSVDNFLGTVFGGGIKGGERNKYLKNFVVFMKEKGIKNEVLKGYVNSYKFISDSDKLVLLSYLDNKNNIKNTDPKLINNQIGNCKLKQGYSPEIIKEGVHKVLYKPYNKYYNVTCKNGKITWSKYIGCRDGYYWNKNMLSYACVKKNNNISNRNKQYECINRNDVKQGFRVGGKKSIFLQLKDGYECAEKCTKINSLSWSYYYNGGYSKVTCICGDKKGKIIPNSFIVYNGNNCTEKMKNPPVSYRSRYPGCDKDDVIIGPYIIASCNVGSNKAGTGVNSYGNYYQYGSENNIWKKDNIIRNRGWGKNFQGPCAKGYHIPSLYDIRDILVRHKYISKKAFINKLQLPFVGMQNTSDIKYIKHSYGYYHLQNGYDLYIDNTGGFNYSSSYGKLGQIGKAVRCFKDYK